MPWYVAASLSAVFAALVSILAKIGIKDIDSNLATAIRTTVILVFTWGIAFFQGSIPSIVNINRTGLIFLVLSGIATGISWLFYFQALKIGDASKVVPIDKLSLVITILLAGLFLKEKINLQTVIGALMMTGGTLLIAFAK
jgi:transporter family protein